MITHPPTICATGETRSRPALRMDQSWNPWLVRPASYHSPQASSACGSAQRPVLPGSGEGVCASVKSFRPAVVHESNSDGRNVGNAQIQVGELRNV